MVDRQGLRHVLSHRVRPRSLNRVHPTLINTRRAFIPKSKIASVADVGLHFTINGQVKQSGTPKDMIFNVPRLISFVSSIMRLEASLALPEVHEGRTDGSAGGGLDPHWYSCGRGTYWTRRQVRG